MHGEQGTAVVARPHIRTLDGLRGVAALAVFGLHLTQKLALFYPLGRAGLAVDFFFLLSGFVVGLAYEQKMRDGLPLSRFWAIRVIRLYPLIVLAALIGSVYAALEGLHPTDWIAVHTLAAALCLPIPFGHPDLFPTNGPEWSLFFELIANLAFGLALFRLSDRWLVALVAAACIVFVMVSRTTGIGGGFTWENAWQGFPRVIFPFALGILLHRLYRAGQLPKIPANFIILSAALVGIFAFPVLPRADWLFVSLAEIVLFPAIIVAAVSCEVSGLTRRLAGAAGELSYPLYLLHVPLIGLSIELMRNAGIDRSVTLWAVPLGVVAIAALAMRYFDDPVRAWLGPHVKARPSVAQPKGLVTRGPNPHMCETDAE